MANPFSTLKDLIHSMEDDFDKSYDKNNAAAGTRVRKGMQEMKNHTTRIRKEVQDMKNAMKASGGAAAAAGAKKAAPAAAKKAAPAAAKKAAPAAAKKAAPAKKK